MKLELSDKDRQYLITAVDSYIRQTGIANAELGLVIVKKLQQQATEAKKQSNGNGS